MLKRGSAKIASDEEKVSQAPIEAPIENYDEMNVDEIMAELDSLTADEVEELVIYESEHKNRKRIVEELDRRLGEGDNEI